MSTIVLAVEANVEYVEVEIPPEFPHSWRRFLPNTFYSASHSPEISLRQAGLAK